MKHKKNHNGRRLRKMKQVCREQREPLYMLCLTTDLAQVLPCPVPLTFF